MIERDYVFKMPKFDLGIKEKWQAILLWGSLLSTILFCYLVFFYSDINATLENSLLFWKAAYLGKLTHFYEFGLEHISSSQWAPNYSILIYIIFAIYNLPVAIGKYIFHVDVMENAIALLWCKSILIIFAFGAAIVLEKIVQYVNTKQRILYLPGLAAFLFLSSLNMVGPVFVITQYDIIAIFFILCGLYSYLKGNEKYFLCFFWLAVPLKSFALLYFVPLLLLREKKIISILLKMFLVYSFSVIEKIIFIQDTAYPFTVGKLNGWGLQRLLESNAELGEYNVSFFLTAFCGICFYCYLRNADTELSENREAIFSTILVSVALTIFVPLNTYWIVFIVSFLILAAVTQRRWGRFSILLETATGILYTIVAVLTKGPYNYAGLVNKLTLPKVIELPSRQELKYGTAKELLCSLHLDSFGIVWETLLVFSLFSIAFLYYIDLNGKMSFLQPEIEGISYKLLLMGRAMILIGFIGVLLYSNLKTETPVIYSTINGQAIVSEYTLNECEIIQPFEVKQDYKVSQLTLYFENESTNKENFASVEVQIVDRNSLETIYSARIGANMISTEVPVILSLKKTTLSAGHQYAIVLNGIPGTKKGKRYHLYPLISISDKMPAMLVNGVVQQCQLYFELR